MQISSDNLEDDAQVTLKRNLKTVPTRGRAVASGVHGLQLLSDMLVNNGVFGTDQEELLGLLQVSICLMQAPEVVSQG